MANKLCDSQGQLIGYIETVEKNMHDGLTRVILHTGHELTFLQGDLIADRGGNLSIRYGGLNAGKKSASAANTAAIKDVIFAPPATIIYWSDGSKTVVKCSEKDVFDPEKGLAMAIAKRCGGSKGSYYKEIQNLVEKSGKKYPGKPAAGKAVDLDVLKKYIAQAKKSYEAALEAATKGDPAHFLSEMGRVSAALSMLEIEINK